jgi:predicted aspartyl protease
MKNLLFFGVFLLALLAHAQKATVSVPFELYGDHIFIQLSVDGSDPKDFIFDTGDGLTVLDIDVAKSLGLALDHKQATSSAQGTITGALIKHNSISLGGMSMESNIKIYATSLRHLEISIGRNVDGIIGYDIFHHHVVGLDYSNMTFNVYDSGFPKNGEAIDIKLVSGIPTINASVTLNDGQKLDGVFYVNTGAGTTMDFNTPYANQNKVIDRTGEHYSYPVKGLGDVEAKHYEGRVKSFTIGGIVVENMPIGISQVTSGLQGDSRTSGIIGNRLLKQFNLMIDVSGKKLYLDPNDKFGKAIGVNCSGVDVQMSGDQSNILIHRVFEGSQAAELGIQADDILISIDGQSAVEMGLMKVEELLKTPGSTVTLTVKRGTETMEFKVELKELI